MADSSQRAFRVLVSLAPGYGSVRRKRPYAEQKIPEAGVQIQKAFQCRRQKPDSGVCVRGSGQPLHVRTGASRGVFKHRGSSPAQSPGVCALS